MQITCLNSIKWKGKLYPPGAVIEVDNDTGKSLIDYGAAAKGEARLPPPKIKYLASKDYGKIPEATAVINTMNNSAEIQEFVKDEKREGILKAAKKRVANLK